MPWPQIEACIRRDPGGRGLSSARVNGQPIASGHLQRAAERLSSVVNRSAVVIVTGFFVADAEPPAPETDGPPGAAYLAQILAACGAAVRVLSDAWNISLLRLAMRANTSPYRFEVDEFPSDLADVDAVDRWSDDYLDARTSVGRPLTLVAVERAGPSHRPDTVGSGRVRFLAEVSPERFDRRHNIRGAVIDATTAPLDRLFERASLRKPAVHTIGVVDGGNEIGCGGIDWLTLREALGAERAAIACRVPTDDVIVAGVSNWGAYALAETVLALAGDKSPREWTAERRSSDQRALLEAMSAAGAVDGITKRARGGVDGLSLDAALSPLHILGNLLRSASRACPSSSDGDPSTT